MRRTREEHRRTRNLVIGDQTAVIRSMQTFGCKSYYSYHIIEINMDFRCINSGDQDKRQKIFTRWRYKVLLVT